MPMCNKFPPNDTKEETCNALVCPAQSNKFHCQRWTAMTFEFCTVWTCSNADVIHSSWITEGIIYK
eukprot:1614998-Amphidinium_carterae.1